MKIDIKYKIPKDKAGIYNPAISVCPNCSYTFNRSKTETLINNSIGFFEDDRGVFLAVECPKCFTHFYFHSDQDFYDDFLHSIDDGLQKHFKR